MKAVRTRKSRWMRVAVEGKPGGQGKLHAQRRSGVRREEPRLGKLARSRIQETGDITSWRENASSSISAYYNISSYFLFILSHMLVVIFCGFLMV